MWMQKLLNHVLVMLIRIYIKKINYECNLAVRV